MLILGHRGAKGLAPENSVEAIEKAIESRADGVEVDVRLHNNTVILSHDPVIAEHSYTTLKDALTCVNGRIPIIIEIKERSVVQPLLKALKDYTGPLTFSSKKYDKYDILQEIKQQRPDANLAVTEDWLSVRAIALASLLDTKELHFNHLWLWGSFVRSMKNRGYSVYAYTVNTQERADELAEWGVNGIFTDYPDRIKA